MNSLLRVQRSANDEPHAMEGASPSPSQAQDSHTARTVKRQTRTSAGFANPRTLPHDWLRRVVPVPMSKALPCSD
jgi:hypothetical protein